MAREGSGERGSGSQETCPSARGPSPSREGRRAMIHRRIGGIAAVLFLLLSSCGESTPPAAPPGTPSQAAAFPLTITDDDGVEVTIADQPDRTVTFAPSMTEIVFELGLGDRLVGVSGPF